LCPQNTLSREAARERREKSSQERRVLYAQRKAVRDKLAQAKKNRKKSISKARRRTQKKKRALRGNRAQRSEQVTRREITQRWKSRLRKLIR
jgi:hypothetical protein